MVGFRADDWPVPNKDSLMPRIVTGDGVIEPRRMTSAADEAGDAGHMGVEIFT